MSLKLETICHESICICHYLEIYYYAFLLASFNSPFFFEHFNKIIINHHYPRPASNDCT